LCDRKLCKDEDVDEYLDEIKQCMISKKVLMVVDDIDMKKNLGALQLCIDKHATNVDYKNKVLINYQNWQILKNCVRGFTKVHMAFLEDEQARELFMFHAFKYTNCVTNDFENIYIEIIKACGTLPLSLEISSCYLCDICDLEIWKGALRELKGGQDIIRGFDNEMFWKTLQISYNRLFKKNQDMFLDFIFLLVSNKIHFVKCIIMEMIHQTLKLQNLKDRF
jgi:hypothetical protein